MCTHKHETHGGDSEIFLTGSSLTCKARSLNANIGPFELKMIEIQIQYFYIKHEFQQGSFIGGHILKFLIKKLLKNKGLTSNVVFLFV